MVHMWLKATYATLHNWCCTNLNWFFFKRIQTSFLFFSKRTHAHTNSAVLLICLLNILLNVKFLLVSEGLFCPFCPYLNNLYLSAAETELKLTYLFRNINEMWKRDIGVLYNNICILYAIYITIQRWIFILNHTTFKTAQ